jgi:hypothetical protein
MFAVLNHGFGAGVFIQTCLRALVVLKWLVVSGVPHVALGADKPSRTLYAEGDLVALVGILSQTLRKPVASEERAPIPRRQKVE